MKKLILVLMVAVAGLTANAQQAKISFESDTIDYGSIEKGSDGVRVFEFTNTGDAPLVITDVKSSCGCTIPKKPENPIAAGEKGKIEIKYDTNRPGPIRKTVTVYSNAEQPVLAVKIKGEVISENKSVLEKSR